MRKVQDSLVLQLDVHARHKEGDAARAEGVGSAITSVLLFHHEEMLKILGVPADEGWQFSCTVTMGYPTGRWGVAPRRPAHEVAYRNQWGEPVGFEIPEPLWSE